MKDILHTNEIWIVLSDDWELRGNGLGGVKEKQSIPATKLMNLYEALGIKATFNVEVMQQIAYERYETTDMKLSKDCKAWKDSVVEMVERGFDVQLHIHPQWWRAEYIDGWWKLNKSWHIVDYAKVEINSMVQRAVAYLQDLIPRLKTQAFRGGAWGMGPPSTQIHNALSANGIILDMSIVAGLKYDGENISLDYRDIDSPYLPYFSNHSDVRKKATDLKDSSGLLEIPTQSVTHFEFLSNLLFKGIKGDRLLLGEFYVYFKTYLIENFCGGFLSKFKKKFKPHFNEDEGPAFLQRDPFGFKSGRSTPPSPIIDLSSRYSIQVWKVLVDICIRRALKLKSKGIKILIFENHTKDLERDQDFERIQLLLEYIIHTYPSVRFKTVSDILPLAEESINKWRCGEVQNLPILISL